MAEAEAAPSTSAPSTSKGLSVQDLSTLNVAELDAIFKESDAIRDTVMRGGRAGSGSELYQIMRDTCAQLQQ